MLRRNFIKLSAASMAAAMYSRLTFAMTFGPPGFHMTDAITAPAWKFPDQTKTNAEIISHLYRSIRAIGG
ncbi:hypothetical protein [Mucilaginibacter sp.]|uniref:hypothetical protein n=1 Tax=Mucilaginibacter sp. TaxID=1882438 RepID=UPI0032665A1B